jgi:hypothetical protein
MPPKTTTKATAAKDETKDEIKQDVFKTTESKPVEEDSKPAKTETKRKTASSKSGAKEPPAKAPRRGRSNAPSPVSPSQLITFLLSPEAAELVRSKDEGELLTSSPDSLSYTSNVPLPPFQELMSALLLSRPISHALGHRSIRTLMNPPWSYTSPKALLNPSNRPEKTPKDGEAAKLAADGGGGEPARVVYMALEQARTQHKAKTASQLIGLAETCISEFCESDGDVGLLKLRKQVEDAGDDAGKVLEDLIKKNVKGLGQTGAEIFRRRLQGCAGWKAVGPFVDARTENVLERMGLSHDADELFKQVEETDVKSGDSKWQTFVIVMERAVEADLQGVVDQVMERAAAS